MANLKKGEKCNAYAAAKSQRAFLEEICLLANSVNHDLEFYSVVSKV